LQTGSDEGVRQVYGRNPCQRSDEIINPNNRSQDLSWSSFAASNPTEIRISSFLQKVDSVRIRPGAFKINHFLKDNIILVNIDNPGKISIEINGDKAHPMLIFAEP
jgi:hypothetical protein